MATRKFKDTSPDENSEDAAIAAKLVAEARASMEPKDVPPILGDDDTIVFTIPNGRKIAMGPPAGGTFRRIAMLLGNEVQGNLQILMGYYKAMLYVRAVDGSPVRPLNDEIAVVKLSEMLGDLGEDMVLTAYSQHWGSPANNIDTVKK